MVDTSKDSSLDDLFDKFSETYTEKLGPIKSFSAKLFIKESDKPRSAGGAIEEELDCLKQQSILEKVT